MYIYTQNNSCEYPLSIMFIRWFKHTAFAVCRAVREADFYLKCSGPTLRS